MRRNCSMGLALTAVLLASCAKSSADDKVATTSETAQAAKSAGYRGDRNPLARPGPQGEPRRKLGDVRSAPAAAAPAGDVRAAGMVAPLSRRWPRQVHQRRRKCVQNRPRGAGLDLLDRRRHRLLFIGSRLAQPQCPAAAGGGADRGDDQLFPLRLCARRALRSSRSAPMSRCFRARGRTGASSSASASRAMRSRARPDRAPTSSS